MPEQRILPPYGDIVIANTPALDRTSALLYQEQKQREVRQRAENQALDSQFQKEFQKVRAVDTPEVIDNYNKYKTLKSQLYYNKNLQRDPKAYNEVQQQANEALSNLYSHINKSAELNQQYKGLVTAHGSKPLQFADNFGDLMTAAQNTPLSKLSSHAAGDLSNADTFAYKGSNTDWQKIETAAVGQPKQTFQKEEKPDALQFKSTPYLFGNTPAQYFQSFLGSLGTHQAARDAEHAWDSMSPEDIKHVEDEYNAITPEKWQRMTGSPNPQPLIPVNPDSKAEKLAILKSKLYAISNEPKEGAPVYRPNLEAQANRKLKDEQLMEGIKHANRKELLNMHEAAKAAGAASENVWIDKFWDGLEEDADNSDPVEYKYKDGRKVYEHAIDINPVIEKAFSDPKIPLAGITKTSDGKIKLYYAKTDDNYQPIYKDGKYSIDEGRTRTITREAAKLALGKKAVTGKQLTSEMLHKPTEKQKPVTPEMAAQIAEEYMKKYGHK